jgi:hypothetical protein
MFQWRDLHCNATRNEVNVDVHDADLHACMFVNAAQLCE